MTVEQSIPVLDVDMGNSRIKWRLSGVGDNKKEAIFGYSEYNRDNWLSFVNLNVKPQRVRIGSVVRDQRLDQIVKHCQNTWQVTAELAQVQDFCAGVSQAYKHKERLGVDRWLGLLAAKHQVGACVLVSYGTAVTVDLLRADGKHLGGYIVPGVAMMHSSLFNGTDAVKVSPAKTLDNLLPGCDTVEAVNKGVVATINGLVNHAVAVFAKESGSRPQVLITGGDGDMMQRFLDCDSIYNPHLVLDGLAVALP